MKAPHDSVPSRVLALRLKRGLYAIRVDAVSGVCPLGAIRAVPLAEPEVLGLTEWHGRLLTVLDLPTLLDDEGLDVPGSLIRLAEPHEYTALMAPGPLRISVARRVLEQSGNASVALLVDDEPHQLIEPDAFVPSGAMQ